MVDAIGRLSSIGRDENPAIGVMTPPQIVTVDFPPAASPRSPYLWSSTKRLLDLALSLLLIAFLLPALAVIAAAVHLTSPGPVFFRQKRGGYGQKEFLIWKFRTMQDAPPDAERAFVRQASRADTRVTPVGRYLRRYSLDELPQLFNVVSGEMSLVGPRPHAVGHDGYFEQQVPGYASRFACKPGITGLAQISGARGETRTIDDMKRRVDLDLEYLHSASLTRDVAIIVRTSWKAFLSDEAY